MQSDMVGGVNWSNIRRSIIPPDAAFVVCVFTDDGVETIFGDRYKTVYREFVAVVDYLSVPRPRSKYHTTYPKCTIKPVPVANG